MCDITDWGGLLRHGNSCGFCMTHYFNAWAITSHAWLSPMISHQDPSNISRRSKATTMASRKCRYIMDSPRTGGCASGTAVHPQPPVECEHTNHSLARTKQCRRHTLCVHRCAVAARDTNADAHHARSEMKQLSTFCLMAQITKMITVTKEASHSS